MSTHHRGKLCAICESRPNDGVGEDVAPRWLVEHYFPPEADGLGYGYAVRGQRIRFKSGKIGGRRDFGAVTLPCCRPCNDTLNARFEQRCRPIVRRLLDNEAPVEFDANEAELLGLWVLKTWLLLLHPKLTDALRAAAAPSLSWDLSEIPNSRQLYRWMTNGQQPPAGLTVWLNRHEPVSDLASREKYVVPMPVGYSGGQRIALNAYHYGILHMTAHLLYHPSFPMANPLAVRGLAHQIWPPTGEPLNYSELPVTERAALQFSHVG